MNDLRTIEELREDLREEIEEVKLEVSGKKTYEIPKILKMSKMRFPLDIIETGREGRVCRQCSSCHTCR